MFLMLHERFIIRTHLSDIQAFERLADAVESPYVFRFPWFDRKPFVGHVNEYRFKIHRRAQFARGYRLTVEGEIRAEPPGCSVDIYLHLHWTMEIGQVAFVALLVVLWAQWLLYEIQFTWNTGLWDPDPLPRAFINLLLLGGFLLDSLFYKIEWSRAKAVLCEWFEAYQVDDAQN